jgi:hypothetical protein
MTLPKWNDPKLQAGTMIRTALWLMSEVGVGNTFTKEQHRQAFAGITQADRRLRDLRDYGWVIRTSTEDVTLRPEEQRFVAAGKPVWNRGIRKDAATDQMTAKQREAAFAESNYQCAVCGIAGGESYSDAPYVTAVLSVSRREVAMLSGKRQTMFVTECKRCRSGGTGAPVPDLPWLLAELRKLDHTDQATLRRWMESDRRQPLDRLWSIIRRLPPAARNDLRKQLESK